MNEAIEKAKRAAELQAKIQAQLATKPNLVRRAFFHESYRKMAFIQSLNKWNFIVWVLYIVD